MPDWKSLVRERLATLRMTAAAESDLADEVVQHLEDRYRELCSGGASEKEAYRKVAAELEDYQSKNDVFGQLAGYTSVRVITWQDTGAPQRLFTELVTGNYFPTLGLAPAKGRFFLPEEDATPGTHAVAVMSYGTWQAR